MNPRLKKVLKIIFYPIVLIRRTYITKRNSYWAENDPIKLASYLYRNANGKKLDWKNPQDLSEKINWMKFYSDTSMWTKLADKYRVRSYVEEKGLSKILVKLYGVWDNVDDIDFTRLPQSFVLKSNNACGTVLLVEDKTKLNIEQTKVLLKKWLTYKIGKSTAEPHYWNIEPVIMAEEYLDMGNDLIDYKLFVVNGHTELVMVCSDRVIGKSAKISLYDSNWNSCPERLGPCHAIDNVPILPRPKTFDEMKEYATILCSDFPFVRMDFYEVNGHVYFGEMTFTPKGGYCNSLTYQEQLRIGQKIILPVRK